MDIEKEVKRQLEILTKGISSVYPENGLEEKLRKALKEERPLRVKLGIDPSSPDVHLGFAVVLQKMRQFQDLGHKAVLIVGDYTARVGDPTGCERTRPKLSRETIRHNFETYLDQMGAIIDKSTVEITHNGKWYRHISFLRIIELLSLVSIEKVLDREDFQNRTRNQIPIKLHEIIYPILQGYDSVRIEADVEICGQDQRFNVLLAREIQEALGQEPQAFITMPLLPGNDGVLKMSKFYGNFIGIAEKPRLMFEKIISIPDWIVPQYFSILLNAGEKEIENLTTDMKEARIELAKRIVKMFHPDADTEELAADALKNGAIPDPEEVRDVVLPALDVVEGKIGVVKLLTLLGLARSTKEAESLISGGEVIFNDEKVVKSRDLSVKTGDVIKVGDRRKARLKLAGK